MKQVSVYELRVGMTVAQGVYDTEDRLLLNQGIILDKGKIKCLKAKGVKEIHVVDPYTLLTSPQDRMVVMLKRLFIETIRRYAPLDPEGNLCDEMVHVSRRVEITLRRMLESSSLIDFCVEMKLINNQCLFVHGVTTSVMSMLIAGKLNMSDCEIVNIGMAGLLHNIGMCEMPFLIQQQNLKGQQLALWKEHATYGYYFANERNFPYNVTKIILSHHECWDGSGFPKGLAGEAIPIGSRIVSVCAHYNDLVIIQGQKPYEAIEYLYGTGNIYFDKRIIDAFTDSIAIYPLGSIVRLSTQEVGVVVNVRKNKGPRPVICIYYNRMNKPYSDPKIIDLGEVYTLFIEEVLG